MVRADGVRIKQVILNLLSNALKYTRQGGVVIATRQEGAVAPRLDVHDDGQGVPKDALDKVFEAFYQVDKQDDAEDGGTGLGLAICKELVDLHGGEMRITSSVGKGTTVSFTLPLAVQISEGDLFRLCCAQGTQLDSTTSSLAGSAGSLDWIFTRKSCMPSMPLCMVKVIESWVLSPGLRTIEPRSTCGGQHPSTTSTLGTSRMRKSSSPRLDSIKGGCHRHIHFDIAEIDALLVHFQRRSAFHFQRNRRCGWLVAGVDKNGRQDQEQRTAPDQDDWTYRVYLISRRHCLVELKVSFFGWMSSFVHLV